jgi:hypothetical protein
VALGFHDLMPCMLSLLTFSSTSMRTRVAWSYIHSDNQQGLDQIVLCCECATVNTIGSVRHDYVDSIDYLLLNPDWPITPCVAISSDGCPYVLVCRDHPKGSELD